jgi:hypothetical protein
MEAFVLPLADLGSLLLRERQGSSSASYSLTGWAVESWEKLMVINGVYLNECQNYLPIYDE